MSVSKRMGVVTRADTPVLVERVPVVTAQKNEYRDGQKAIRVEASVEFGLVFDGPGARCCMAPKSALSSE